MLAKVLLLVLLPIISTMGKALRPFLESSLLRTTLIAASVIPALVSPVDAVSGGGKEFAQKDIRGQDFSAQKFQGQDFTQCDGAGTNFKVFS